MSTDRKNLGRPEFWRSLDELEQTPQFVEMLHREFPASASEWNEAHSRRTFLKVMGASLALAGIGTGCRVQQDEKIVPYVAPPEQMVPGKPLLFTTSLSLGGYGRGAIVESHEGRPTKVEGNPDHPSSLGATDIWMQAAVLDLYDPDRSQTVLYAGEVSDWGTFINDCSRVLKGTTAKPTAQVRILTETVTSPSLVAQIQSFIKSRPNTRWHQYTPADSGNTLAAARAAFGRNVRPIYKLDQARVIVSLDEDFLHGLPGSVRYARDFIEGRRVRDGQGKMNRLYVAESTTSITGAMADHRVRVKPSLLHSIALAIASAAGVQGVSAPTLDNATQQWIAQVAKDLTANRGAGVVVVGENQPAAVHVVAHAVNNALGNTGKTIVFIDSPAAEPDQNASITDLVNDINNGQVDVLLMLGGNPVYNAPADVNFLGAIQSEKLTLKVHLAHHFDETSFQCQWHLPLAHELESWGDVRAHDGTASIVQPLINPMYQGRTETELLATLSGEVSGSYEMLRHFWRGQGRFTSDADFDAAWNKWLKQGFIEGTTYAAVNVAFRAEALTQALTPPPASNGLEVSFRLDPSIYDGRYANNAWLQELPKPLTKICWDNAVYMSESRANQLGVVNGQEVQLTVNNRTVSGPAWIVPGHPDDAVTAHLGYGRSRAGRVGTGGSGRTPGFDAYKLRTTANPTFGPVQLLTNRKTWDVACTQNHQLMEGRDLIKVKLAGDTSAEGHGLDEQHGSPQSVEAANGKHARVPLSLFKDPYSYEDNYKWGMVIDQNACIGCNACVVACVAENNIPMVGREQVAYGREMFWLRVDTYYRGESKPETLEGPFFQPLPCMHCEKAPCEVVCPVNATVHDAEGLNDMVYNRCVGTRYCSNNCPYKVRHFNFLAFWKNDLTGENQASRALQRNPDVTVRSRGVMEKCTYCVQRISRGRIEAKKLEASLDDAGNTDQDRADIRGKARAAIDSVVSACAQACPTQAIFFGDLNNKQAPVTQLAMSKDNYGLLEELQTQPRTTYLPRYVNPVTGSSAAAETAGHQTVGGPTQQDSKKEGVTP